MNILMLSSTFPYPATRGATEGRTFNLLKYLHQRHTVTLITQRDSGITDEDVEALRQWTSELVVFPLPSMAEQRGIQSLWGKVARFVEAIAKATPPNVLYRYSSEMQQWIDTQVQAGKVDVIDCEHSVNEVYIRPEFRQTVGTVVDVHSSVYGWVRDHLEKGASSHPLRDRLYLTLLLKRYEKRYCGKFTTVVVTTDEDRQKLYSLSPQSQFAIVPNGVDLEMFPYRSQDPGGHNLMFIGGMNSTHNIDAACFFATDVFPLIRDRYRDATFTIVGANPTPQVMALGDRPGVFVTGRVPAVVDYMHQATVCVVPLRVGLGIKTKTLETMAGGTPIVASNLGVEGLTVDGDGVPLRVLRANQVNEYVDAIGRLLTDASLRDELSRNGRALVEAEYTWERAGQRYEQALLQAKPSFKSSSKI